MMRVRARLELVEEKKRHREKKENNLNFIKSQPHWTTIFNMWPLLAMLGLFSNSYLYGASEIFLELRFISVTQISLPVEAATKSKEPKIKVEDDIFFINTFFIFS